jgi:cephalosporin hydroxylase
MWKDLVKKVAYAVAPKWARRVDVRRWNRRLGLEFRDKLSACATLRDKVELIVTDANFRSSQRRTEILGLAERVQTLKPKLVAEIGSYQGGTLALFAQAAEPNARLLSLDIQYTPELVFGFPSFAREKQTITLHEGDSHKDDVLAFLRQWLGGEKLDFLFIDGDHSFDGVAKDFAMYAPFVRPGGLIAFHDINPDHFQQHGQRGLGDTGEVPLFWRKFKEKGYTVEELIEDPGQDGMGIGVVRWDGVLR